MLVMIKLLQINLHHCKLASANLQLHINRYGANVILIQEPWVCKSHRIRGLRFKGFKLLAVQNKGKPRACILVSDNINCCLIPRFSDGDIVVANIAMEDLDLHIASVYMASDLEIPPPKVVELTQLSMAQKRNLILACDANAHHTIWGSTDINMRGELLLDFIISTNLTVANKGCKPTFINSIRQEVIDITLVSDSLSYRVLNWHVADTNSFSDHCYIEFSLLAKAPKMKPRRCVRLTDWELYRERVSNSFSAGLVIKDSFTTSDVEESVNNVTKVLNSAFREACPLRTNKGKAKPPWWNEELNILRKTSRKSFNRAKRSRLSVDWSGYKDDLRAYNKEVRKAKRSSWQEFCLNIEDTSEASRLRKVLASSPCTVGLLRKPDQSWTESSEETLALLIETHFPDCAMLPLRDNPCVVSACKRQLPNEDPFSHEAITWAVQSFKPFKSPGPDNVSPKELTVVLDLLLPWLKAIFSACLKLSFIPSKWRMTSVVFIPKQGRSNPENPKDFRPISLSSFLLKTMERIIESEIRNSIPLGCLSDSQHAYSRGRSTESALHSLVYSIERSFSYKESTLAAFLDIEGAFNNVTSTAIIESMLEVDVCHEYINLAAQIITTRKIISVLGCTTLTRYVARGTPQGGVLSPLLWNLVINSLLVKLEKSGVKVIAYADDVALVASGKFVPVLRDLVQGALNHTTRWAKSCGLDVNPDKTELVLFTRKNSIPDFPLPRIAGKVIKLSAEVKYLGVILDRKLLWKSNVIDRARKSLIALYACKSMIGKRWGLSPKIVKWLYVAIVRPILFYGSIVWWISLDKTYLHQVIRRVQRQATIAITGALRTTPSDALDVLLYLPPVDLFAQELAANCAVRLRAISLFKCLQEGHSTILVRAGCPNLTLDYCTPVQVFQRNFEVFIPTREDWTGFSFEEEPEEAICFFTDGSKLNNQVGFGVFSRKLNLFISARLPDYCSVFQAEVSAITEVMRWLKRNVITHLEVIVFCDSQAALKALDSFGLCSRVVTECLDSLNEMGKFFRIRLVWIPGHQGFLGNCEADALARDGTTAHPPLDQEGIGIPISTCRLIIREHLSDVWNNRWVNLRTCNHARCIWPALNVRRSKDLVNLPRKVISVVVAIITGHCLIGHHASRLGVETPDFCRSCLDEEEEESVFHLLCSCPALARRRMKVFGSAELTSLTDLSIYSIKSFSTFARLSCWFREVDW